MAKPEGKRPLRRTWHRTVNNIKKYLLEVECGYVNWIRLARDRECCWTHVSAVINFLVP